MYKQQETIFQEQLKNIQSEFPKVIKEVRGLGTISWDQSRC